MKPINSKFASEAEVSKDRIRLMNPYAHLDECGSLSALASINLITSRSEISTSRFVYGNQYAHIDENGELRAISLKKNKYSNKEIDKKVESIHRLIWRNRGDLWGVEPSHVDMLDPIKAFELIGYKIHEDSSLGEIRENGRVIEAAGLIDNDNREVRISQHFKPEIRRFTAAHELGHALMHSQSGLHRDRPIDGVLLKARQLHEVEADSFASRFLMPKKLLTTHYKKRFLTDKFICSEETLHAFRKGDTQALANKLKTTRDLSRLLATVEQYNGMHFISLAALFKVSAEAMAIRIEELGLLKHLN